jgi:hypothetical protein
LPCTPGNRFQQLKEQGADVLLTVNANQRTLHRQIQCQFEGKRQIPFLAMDQEIGHGRDITWTPRTKEAPEHIRPVCLGTIWIVDVVTTGTRDGKPFNAIHLFLSSHRTSPEELLQLERNRWSIEGWHWIRDTQLHDACAIATEAMAQASWEASERRP